MNSTRIIAIANQKGGVGKTVTVASLGAALVECEKKVLLVDADPQASLTGSLYPVVPDKLDRTLASAMASVMSPGGPLAQMEDRYGILHHEEGVDILPSNIDLAAIEVGLVNTSNREYVLRDALIPLMQHYDYILIDCMPSLGMLTINAMAAAGSVIIPTQANFLSARGLTQLLNSIAKVRRQINPILKIEGVLMTMVNARTNDAKAVIASLRSQGDRLPVFDAQIPYSVRVAEANVHQKSILVYDRNGKVTAAYRGLAKEVINHYQKERERLVSPWNKGSAR